MMMMMVIIIIVKMIMGYHLFPGSLPYRNEAALRVIGTFSYLNVVDTQEEEKKKALYATGYSKQVLEHPSLHREG